MAKKRSPKLKTCTLQVKVTYNPKLTNPDALASALDILLATAMSTPGILDECGDPSVGGFTAPPGGDTWKCPKCGHTQVFDTAEIAEIGTPWCSECGDGDTEMEIQDD